MKELKMFRPMRSKKISQRFGENIACIYYESRKIIGIRRNKRCPDGSRPFYQSLDMEGHNGYDIPAVMGEKIYHNGDFNGTMKTEVDMDGGIGVDIVSDEMLFFDGPPPKGLRGIVEMSGGGFLSYVKIRHWHLKAPLGYDGKKVKFGDPIGLAGSTGASSGPHDHMGLKWCNARGRALLPDNGYFGAFDPEPFMDWSKVANDVAKSRGAKKELTPDQLKVIVEQISIIRRILLGLREQLAKL